MLPSQGLWYLACTAVNPMSVTAGCDRAKGTLIHWNKERHWSIGYELSCPGHAQVLFLVHLSQSWHSLRVLLSQTEKGLELCFL